jgi:hypothetical protein
MSMKNFSEIIGNQSRNLPVCSAVPQPLLVKIAHFHPATCNMAHWLTKYGSSTIYTCFELPQLLYRWGHQPGILWIHTRIAYCIGQSPSWEVDQSLQLVKKSEIATHHVTKHNTPIHNILSTAPQLSISQKALGTLPEDDNVMPKHVGATIHN